MLYDTNMLIKIGISFFTRSSIRSFVKLTSLIFLTFCICSCSQSSNLQQMPEDSTDDLLGSAKINTDVVSNEYDRNQDEAKVIFDLLKTKDKNEVINQISAHSQLKVDKESSVSLTQKIKPDIDKAQIYTGLTYEKTFGELTIKKDCGEAGKFDFENKRCSCFKNAISENDLCQCPSGSKLFSFIWDRDNPFCSCFYSDDGQDKIDLLRDIDNNCECINQASEIDGKCNCVDRASFELADGKFICACDEGYISKDGSCEECPAGTIPFSFIWDRDHPFCGCPYEDDSGNLKLDILAEKNSGCECVSGAKKVNGKCECENNSEIAMSNGKLACKCDDALADPENCSRCVKMAEKKGGRCQCKANTHPQENEIGCECNKDYIISSNACVECKNPTGNGKRWPVPYFGKLEKILPCYGEPSHFTQIDNFIFGVCTRDEGGPRLKTILFRYDIYNNTLTSYDWLKDNPGGGTNGVVLGFGALSEDKVVATWNGSDGRFFIKYDIRNDYLERLTFPTTIRYSDPQKTSKGNSVSEIHNIIPSAIAISPSKRDIYVITHSNYAASDYNPSSILVYRVNVDGNLIYKSSFPAKVTDNRLSDIVATNNRIAVYGLYNNEADDHRRLIIFNKNGTLLKVIESINGHRIDDTRNVFECDTVLYNIPNTSLLFVVGQIEHGDLLYRINVGDNTLIRYRVRAPNIIDVLDLDTLEFKKTKYVLPTYDTTMMDWGFENESLAALHDTGLTFWDYQYPLSFANDGTSSLVYYADISGYVSSFLVRPTPKDLTIEPTEVFFFNPLEICDGQITGGGPQRFDLLCDDRYMSLVFKPQLFYFNNRIITIYGKYLTSITYCN